MSLQSTPFLLAVTALSVAGLIANDGHDYFVQTENFVNGPLIFGITILLHSAYGAPGVTDRPKVLETLMQNFFVKVFILFLLAFAAVRDFEDTIFVTLLFLTITQLLRTKEERERHPTIL